MQQCVYWGEVGDGQGYFLQLCVDLDGNHKNIKNHQNKTPQGKIIMNKVLLSALGLSG